MTKNRTKSEDKRRLILTAAVRLFVEHGFTQITMIAIAEQAGVSKQTVYSHFGNKEDLFAAAIEHKCLSLGLGDESLPRDRDIATTLTLFAQRFGAFITADEAIKTHRLCASETQKLPQLADIFFRLGPNMVLTKLTEYFADKTQQGEINVPQPRWAASQFLSLIMGEARLRAELNQLDEQTLAERDQYLLSCVAMFLKAYAE